jgi:hypothetical protein
LQYAKSLGSLMAALSLPRLGAAVSLPAEIVNRYLAF